MKLGVFASGCFWCTEAVFKRLKGVSNVKSGYTGGFIKNPPYREVCQGRTGIAEIENFMRNYDGDHIVGFGHTKFEKYSIYKLNT